MNYLHIETMQIKWDIHKRNNKQIKWDGGTREYVFANERAGAST